MIYSGSSGDSLIEDITFRTGVDTTQFLLVDRNRYINEAYSRVASIIIQSDGRMQWDDPNHTDAPVAQTNIVSGQQKYNIFSSAPSALQDWLYIERIEIVDSSSNGYQLEPLDEKDLGGIALSEYKKTAAIPEEFDFNGTEISLYPPANYNATLGMTMYFKRSPSYFSVADTTKRPGFATIFHPYLSIYTAHQWNSLKKKDFSLQNELARLEAEIGKFYSRRPRSLETPLLSNRAKKFLK